MGRLERKPKSFNSLFITLGILLCIGSYILMFDGVKLPSKFDDPEYIEGIRVFDKYINTPNPRYWEFNIGNGYISNIESIVIWLCYLWSLLRIIDLLYYEISYQKNLNKT